MSEKSGGVLDRAPPQLAARPKPHDSRSWIYSHSPLTATGNGFQGSKISGHAVVKRLYACRSVALKLKNDVVVAMAPCRQVRFSASRDL